MNPKSLLGLIPALLLVLIPTAVFSQTNYSDKVNEWKRKFPKSDVVAVSYKETVDFSINTAAGPGESRIKATVSEEIILVPLKDFQKYDDAVFYHDEKSVDNLKVFNPEGKEVKVEKLCGPYRQESIFHSDLKICVFKMQLAEKGKAFRYTYQSNYRDIKYLTSFYFYHYFPVLDRQVQFNIPSWMEVDLKEFNFAGEKIEKTSVRDGDITRHTFRMQDLPAYTREPRSPNHALSFPHLICVSRAYSENGQRQPLFESVKDLYGWYRTLCNDIGNKPEVLKSRVESLTAGKKTDMEKIESLFYWVQDNIRYIAFENGIMGFKPEAAQNVYNNKFGDCKGKANLLKEMLRLAGYDARLTWIGTSDLPYDYSLPSLAVDNHMICTVILNGKKYYLDGTEDFIAFNDYAQRIQGKQVLIEDGNNYILETVPQFPAERNKKSTVTRMSISGDRLEGTSAIEYNGESRINLQRVNASVRNDNRTEVLSGFLKLGSRNMEVSNISNPDFSDRQKPLKISFDFTAENQVTRVGNELYIVMDWYKDFADMEIPSDRKNDYEFRQKYYITVQTELTIPEGYKVDYLPPALKKTTPDFSFEGTFTSNGKAVVYRKTIIISKPILRKGDFAAWNAFVASINKFYNEQVVFTK